MLNIRKKASLLVLLLLCLPVFSGCSLFDNGLILPNVTAAGIDISGKTMEEAKTLIQRQTDLTYPCEDMVIELPSETLRLSPADTGVVLDVDAMVEDAFNYGRSGTWQENRAVRKSAETTAFDLPIGKYLTLDTDYIRTQLDAYVTAHTSTFAQSSVTVEGEAPSLKAKDFDPDAPCQTIQVYTGNPGYTVDISGVYELVIEAYHRNEFLVTADIPEEETLPDPIDLTALYEDTKKDPINATVDKATYKIINETYGYDFDLEAAAARIAETPYNETITISYRYIEPKWTAKKLRGDNKNGLFSDVLATYQTAHTAEASRNTNLKLACKSLNGMVLLPGEQFDYNKALGERTAARGYQAAGAYVNGVTVDTIGGGICQVSSTLYYCTLLADLQIDTRLAHSYVSSYMPKGMDATVSWGGPDFRFTNNTGYPIKIEAWVADGYVHIRLLGSNTKDYTVKMEAEVLSTTDYKTEYKVMTSAAAKKAGYYDGKVLQTPYTGYSVKSYKCKYDKNGKLISRTYEATSNYKVRNKIVVRIQD